MKKVIVLGANGMLGHKVFEVLSKYKNFDVYGTVTNIDSFGGCLPKKYESKIIENIYADKIETIDDLIKKHKPNILFNGIGIIKQNKEISDTINSIVINALFPNLVSNLCDKYNCRFITIATDCVFDGQKGNYVDDDLPTCHDVYGMTKYLGEVKNKNNTLTLRTSIIGHELYSNISLLDWFLSQENMVKGYKKAIFSGFTTLEFSKLLVEKIIPNEKLHGLFQISVDPISKYDLLKVIASTYKKNIIIEPNDDVKIDRSLNSEILRNTIKYNPPKWETMIVEMYNNFLESDFYKYKRKNYEKTNKF